MSYLTRKAKLAFSKKRMMAAFIKNQFILNKILNFLIFIISVLGLISRKLLGTVFVAKYVLSKSQSKTNYHF